MGGSGFPDVDTQRYIHELLVLGICRSGNNYQNPTDKRHKAERSSKPKSLSHIARNMPVSNCPFREYSGHPRDGQTNRMRCEDAAAIIAARMKHTMKSAFTPYSSFTGVRERIFKTVISGQDYSTRKKLPSDDTRYKGRHQDRDIRTIPEIAQGKSCHQTTYKQTLSDILQTQTI